MEEKLWKSLKPMREAPAAMQQHFSHNSTVPVFKGPQDKTQSTQIDMNATGSARDQSGLTFGQFL